MPPSIKEFVNEASNLVQGKNLSWEKTWSIIKNVHQHTGVVDATHLLPWLFKFKGKPLTLKDHFPMEPLFHFGKVPRRVIYKCGRQVGKSLSVSLRLLTASLVKPYLGSLVILPRYEQTRRLSSNYVQRLMDDSPMPEYFGLRDEHSILQKNLPNGSTIQFSYAFLSADKARGIPADQLSIDETQDVANEHIPIIRECLSASPLRIETYSGTPKTFDNSMETLWGDCSGAEWHIPCKACGKENIPTREQDALKMIGKTTIVCAKCERSINPREGGWVHHRPELRHIFSGYHFPQMLLPQHYADESAWFLIRQKMNYASHLFWNECMGESYDMGTRLFSLEKLRDCAKLPHCISPEPKDYTEAIGRLADNRFLLVVMGVDWGGGGVDEISRTAVSVVGMLPSGVMEVIWMDAWPSLGEEENEARKILTLFKDFRCEYLAHDFGGAGSLREVLLVQAGIDGRKVVPFVYDTRRADSTPIITFHGGGRNESRSYYNLDKTRSLDLLSKVTKINGILFPKRNRLLEEYFSDFTALYCERSESPRGADWLLVRRSGKRPDDLAHATNYAVSAMWQIKGKWPQLAKSFGV